MAPYKSAPAGRSVSKGVLVVDDRQLRGLLGKKRVDKPREHGLNENHDT